ncbi:GNAT family N-acetyltransferase [Paracoccus saliphilus]|uniref:Aminoglycoside 6'-N-acetyltransferase n=1 Tax=Paracoccus saliphilus TaxID=405559 RepID=A0AA46A6V8_9RHOB|nr:GNAT family N-acetyltransferase [Paracoccus saliphilus]WCR02836.1 GNAT family N-acetyltransferase [Paracoccus saliphilus]SIT03872.1 aminoglycoside 6'-N-acetyltransferase [Paracoccus saliphilus]
MPDYGFRPVRRDDLPMLAEWLRDPLVAEWWTTPDHQLALVTEDLDNPAMRQLIALHGETPIGYAQHSPAHEWKAPHFHDLPKDAIAIDVFTAPEGQGHGGAWLRALGDLLLREVSLLVIDPSPENLRAIRAYEKAGFAGDTIRLDSEGQPARIMTRLR